MRHARRRQRGERRPAVRHGAVDLHAVDGDRQRQRALRAAAHEDAAVRQARGRVQRPRGRHRRRRPRVGRLVVGACIRERRRRDCLRGDVDRHAHAAGHQHAAVLQRRLVEVMPGARARHRGGRGPAVGRGVVALAVGRRACAQRDAEEERHLEAAGRQHAAVGQQAQRRQHAEAAEVGGHRPRARRRVVDLGRVAHVRDRRHGVEQAARAAGDEHAAVGHAHRGVQHARRQHAARRRECVGDRVVDLARRQHRAERIGAAAQQHAAVRERHCLMQRARAVHRRACGEREATEVELLGRRESGRRSERAAAAAREQHVALAVARECGRERARRDEAVRSRCRRSARSELRHDVVADLAEKRRGPGERERLPVQREPVERGVVRHRERERRCASGVGQREVPVVDQVGSDRKRARIRGIDEPDRRRAARRRQCVEQRRVGGGCGRAQRDRRTECARGRLVEREVVLAERLGAEREHGERKEMAHGRAQDSRHPMGAGRSRSRVRRNATCGLKPFPRCPKMGPWARAARAEVQRTWRTTAISAESTRSRSATVVLRGDATARRRRPFARTARRRTTRSKSPAGPTSWSPSCARELRAARRAVAVAMGAVLAAGRDQPHPRRAAPPRRVLAVVRTRARRRVPARPRPCRSDPRRSAPARCRSGRVDRCRAADALRVAACGLRSRS